ncbi:MAG: hypothetical protein J2P57_14545 [Acidimicrobiaceae bacterium]|nr:hypothetical protein [Acidimicrobiaceae bacterium]
MVQHVVTARNPARASENRIHDDAVARRYGFRGGLVPGVTVYGYACAPILDALGPDWVASGSASMRFHSPCYEGEQVELSVTEGAVAASVGDRLCASGTVAVGEVGPELAIPAAGPPASRPAASEEVFNVGRVLGSVPLDTAPDVVNDYLEAIGEPSPLYLERGWVHPGLLLNAANSVLVANVVLPAWVHVESAMQHRRPVRTGEAVEVRARVAESFERRGHHFVALDVAWVAGDALVATARHVAIWQLASSPG